MNLFSEKVTIRIPKELLSAAKKSASAVDCKLSDFLRSAILYSTDAINGEKNNNNNN